MKIEKDKLLLLGNTLVEIFHYFALFVIGSTIVWSATHEYLQMMQRGFATLEDILLLFIYLELGAMVGIYFKTKRLPVQFLIFIAITALSRHMIIDVQHVSESFHLYLILAISVSIILLCGAIFILGYTFTKYGCPEESSREDSDHYK